MLRASHAQRRTDNDTQLWRRLVVGGMAIIGVMGCADLQKLAGTQELPAGTSDPKTLQTAEGALAAYRGAVAKFEFVTSYTQTGAASFGRSAFLDAVIISGRISDELEPNKLGGSAGQYLNVNAPVIGLDIDARWMTETSNRGRDVYNALQAIRTATAQGIGALSKYAPQTSPALRGHLYALKGYAELLLADLFCSGVPLSEFQFEGDYVYRSGSTTAEIYKHAVVLFDSALAISSDSSRIMNLARVGKGRALLNLGEYTAAIDAVQEVPNDFRYEFPVDWGETLSQESIFEVDDMNGVSVADRKGINGFPYRSSGDPRTAVVSAGQNAFGVPRYFPEKYGTPSGISNISVATGIEARLIQAEALYHAGGNDWLTTLNALRTNGTFTVTQNPDDPNQVDTTWHAGLGGVDGLKPFENPQADTAKVSLIFAERAAWLYLSGARQGDLRRMIRQYRRSQEEVYPIGPYPLPLYSEYGSEVTLVVPKEERSNPLFTGCFDRSA
jgi:tetratricopeptide (TPR) repeat protein